MRKRLGLLALGLLIAGPVLAQGISIRNTAGTPNSQVFVDVVIDAQTKNLGGVQFTLNLSGTTPALVLTGAAQKGHVFSGGNDVVQAQANGATAVNVLAASPQGVNGPGSVVSVPVTIPAAATAGTTYNLTLTDVKAVDAANASVALTPQGGTITVLGANSQAVTVGTVTGAPGATVQVPLQAVNLPALQSLRVQLEIGGLSTTGAVGSFTAGAAVGAGMTANSSVRPDTGLVEIDLFGTGAGTQQIVGSGNLGSLAVTIPATAKTGDIFPVSVALLQAQAVGDPNNFLTTVSGTGGSIITQQNPPPGSTTVEVGSVEGKSGDTVNIPIRLLTSQVPLGGIQATVNTGALIPGKAISGPTSFSGANDVLTTNLQAGGVAQVVGVTAGSINAPTVLFLLPVTIPDATPNGTTFQVSISAIQGVTAGNQTVPVTVTGSGVVTVAANPQVTPELTIGNAQAAPGQSAFIDVSVSNVASLGGVTATFNIGSLQAGKAVAGTLFGGANDVVTSDTSTAGTIKVTAVNISAANATNPGVAFRIPITVPAGATPGTVQISATGVQIVNGQNQQLPQAQITVGNFTILQSNPVNVPADLQISDAQAAPGQSANVQVRLASASKVGAVRFTVTLPPGLTSGDPVKGDLFTGANDILSFNRTNSGQTLDIVLVSPGTVTGPGTLVTLPITVNSLSPAATVQITGSGATAVDPDNNNLAANFSHNGAFTILGGQPGTGVVNIQVDNAQAQAGTIVNVPVRLTNNQAVGAIRVKLTLANGLTVDPTKIQSGGLFSSPTDVIQATVTGQTVDVLAVTAGSATGPGVLFALPVQVATGSTGSLAITPTSASAIDPTNKALTQGTLGAGAVTITPNPPAPVPVDLTVGTVSGNPGSTVQLPVILDSATTLGAIRVTLTLPAGFTVNGAVAKGSLISGANDQVQANVTNQTVDVVIVSVNGIKGPGTLFTVPVQIPAGATAGAQPVSATVSQAIGTDNAAVPTGTIKGGSITVQGGQVVPVVDLAVDNASIAAGSNGVLTVRVSNSVALGAVKLRLTLPAGVTAASGVTLTPGTLFAGANDVRQANVSGQTVDVVLVSPTTAQGPGTLFSLPVSVAAGTTGTGQVTISNVQAITPDNLPVNPQTLTAGTITFSGPPPAGHFDLTVGSQNNVAPGTTVNVPVTLDNAVAVGALNIRLRLSAGLTIPAGPVTLGAGTLFTGATDIRQATANGQIVDVALVTTGTATGPGTLFTLPVTLAAGATTDQSIFIDSASAIDPTNNPLTAGTFKSGTISLTIPPPPGHVDLTVDNATIQAGTSGAITVRVANAVALGAIRFQLTLPTGVTAAPGVTLAPGTLFAGANDVRQANVSGQTVDVVLVSPTSAQGPGTLFSLPVSVAAGTTGSGQVTISNVEAIDASNNSLTPGTLTAGTITFGVPPPPGHFDLTVGSQTNVTPGTSLNIPVTLDNAVAVGAIQIRLRLSAGLTIPVGPVTLGAGTLFTGATEIRQATANGQIVDVALVTPATATGPGTLFTLPVTLAAGATGDQSIFIDSASAIDPTNSPLTPGKLTAGTISQGVPPPPKTVDLAVDNATVQAGGPAVPVTVRVTNATSSLGAIRFQLNLPAGLSVAANATLTAGTLFAGANDVRQVHVNGQTVDVVLVTPAAATGAGTLFTIPVSANANTPAGTAQITISNVEAIDPSNVRVTAGTLTPGTITITPSQPVGNVSVSVSDATIPAGSTVPVTVNLTSNSPVGAIRFKLNLPTGLSVATGATLTPGALFAGANDVRQANVNGQTVDVVLASPGSVTGPGTLFTIPVTAATSAAAGVVQITVTDLQAIDPNNAPLTVGTVTPGNITITKVVPPPSTFSLSVADQANVAAGSTINVPVSLSSTTAVGAIRVHLTLSSGLSIPAGAVTLGAGTLFAGANDVRQANAAGQGVDVVLVSPGTVQGPGTIFTLPVTVAAAATSPQTISIDSASAIDPSNNPLTLVTPKNGTITVAGVQPSKTVDVSVSDATAAPGQTVPVTVSVTNPVDLGALSFRLTLSSGLTVPAGAVTLTPGALFAGATDLRQANASGQNIDVALVSSGTAQGPGALFTFNVTVAANATGNQTITVSNVSAIDSANKPVAQGVLKTGTITISGGNAPIQIGVGNVSGAPGESIRIPITLDTATTVGAIHVTLCATGGLTFTGADFAGSLFADPDVKQFHVSADGTKLDVVLVSTGSHLGPGLLFNALATISSTATGNIQVTVCGLTAIDQNNVPIPLGPNGGQTPGGGVITVNQTPPTTSPSVSVRSANVKAGVATTVPVALNNAPNVGALDITLQLSNTGIGTFVTGSGQPAGANSGQNVVEATDLGGGKIRLVVVSPNALPNNDLVATFQIQGAAGLAPWTSSIVSVVSVTALSTDNKTLTALNNGKFSNGTLIAGAWVNDPGVPSSAAPTVSTIQGLEVAFIGHDSGLLQALKTSDGTAALGNGNLVSDAPISRRMTVKDGNIYTVSTSGKVAKISGNSGGAVWSVTLPGGLTPSTSPSVASDGTRQVVFVGTQQGSLVKLSDADGSVVGTPANLNNGPITADPAASDNPAEVWVGAGTHVLQINSADLTPKKDFTAAGPVTSAPFISANVPTSDPAVLTKLVAIGAGTQLLVFNSGTGAQIGSYDAKDAITAASYVDVQVAGNQVTPTAYVVTATGSVHAISLAGLNVGQTGQTLTGLLIGSIPPGSDTAIIAAGTPRYGYTTLTNGVIAGVKLPAGVSGPFGAGATPQAAYEGFAPAVGQAGGTLIVTLKSGATIALPLLPSGTVGM